MNKNQFIKRLLCLVLGSVLLLVSFNFTLFADETTPADTSKAEKSSNDEYKQQITDLQSKQKDLKKEQDALAKKINNAKSQKNSLQAEVLSIDEQMDLKEQEIEVIQQKIDLTNTYLNNKQKQISFKEEDISDNLDIFRERIRAMYVTGGFSNYQNSLLMLLTSRSVSEFLTRSEYLKRISQHDTELVEELKAELKSLENEKALLLTEKKGLQAEQDELKIATDELEEQKNIAKTSIQDISAMQREYEANYEELSKQSKALQAEIANIYANLKTSSADYVGGEMMWPVPGHNIVSCEYGWRFNNTDFHTGMDITGNGCHGAKVVAANTGTVIYTNYCPYNGKQYGYGTYIILDHGGNITTLYAHLSKITVKVGDIVAMGEQIGNVGSTGWSTGAHLHFEVRKNGSHVNPRPYIT